MDASSSGGSPTRAAALEWAAAARARRDQVRTDLRSGAIELPAVLAERRSDAALGTVRLLWVLESVPGARKVDTRRRLTALEIDPSMALSGVDDSLVGLLLDEFGTPAGADR